MSSGHGGGRRKKHEEHEEHENHERWLVSAFDMMTLLFVLFVVLFAMSKVDEEKFAQLAAGLSEAFGTPVSVIPAATTEGSPLDGLPGVIDVSSVDPPEATVEEADTVPESSETARTAAEAAEEHAALSSAREQLQESAAAAGFGGAVSFEITEDGLVMHITSDPVLFDAESAVLVRKGREILDAVAPALAGLPNRIEVQGHANSIPVTPGGPWSSNWALSSARAVTVLEYLIRDGVAQNRLEAVGWSDQRPLVPDTDPGAVTTNRRVDVLITSTASAEANALLPGLDGVPAAPAPASQSSTEEDPHG